MTTGSRTTVLAAIAGVIVLFLLWIWLRTESPTPADIALSSTEETAQSQEPATEEVAEPEGEEAGRAGTTAAHAQADANSTKPVPDEITPSPTEALPEPLSVEQEVVQREVESSIAVALAGDQNEAIELGSFLNQCQFTFRDRARVESSIERAARSFAEGKPLTQFRPSSPAQEFETLDAFESSQWDTFFRCEAARRLVNDDFWSNLEQQAEAGNPVARYLFATLVRENPATINAFENWDEDMQRREQSRDYTWRNLEDREPLGLLALVELDNFGLSLRGNSISNSSVLIVAAVKCGLSSRDLLQSVDRILQMAERLETAQPGALERLNTASDEAKRMFCK